MSHPLQPDAQHYTLCGKEKGARELYDRLRVTGLSSEQLHICVAFCAALEVAREASTASYQQQVHRQERGTRSPKEACQALTLKEVIRFGARANYEYGTNLLTPNACLPQEAKGLPRHPHTPNKLPSEP